METVKHVRNQDFSKFLVRFKIYQHAASSLAFVELGSLRNISWSTDCRSWLFVFADLAAALILGRGSPANPRPPGMEPALGMPEAPMEVKAVQLHKTGADPRPGPFLEAEGTSSDFFWGGLVGAYFCPNSPQDHSPPRHRTLFRPEFYLRSREGVSPTQ